MLGSFITRGLVMVFGYAYPAYECFKTVEMNKPDIQQLRFWCQYWILVAMLTVCERFGDAFISWVPMYSEAKLAFVIYLWCPKTKGTTYVYDAFFRPVVLRHEPEIDKNLLELRTRAGDMIFLYWQQAASYGQTRVFDILQYIASQSNPPPHTQPQRQSSRGQPTATLNRRSSASATQVQAEEQAPLASSESSSEDEADTTEEAGSSKAPPPASTEVANAQKTTPFKSMVSTVAASLNTQKASLSKALAETTKPSTSVETRVMQIDSVPSSANGSGNPPAETALEEAVRVTRARSRKTMAGGNP